MRRNILFKLFCIVGYVIASYLLAMQLAYFLSFGYDIQTFMQQAHLCLNPDIMFWQGNSNYFILVTEMILVGLFVLVMWLFFPSKRERERRREERRLTREEQRQYTHLASVHEAKKGLQRFQFNRHGNMDHVFYQQKKYWKSIWFWIGKGLIIVIVVAAMNLIIKAAVMILYLAGISNINDVSFRNELIVIPLAIFLFILAGRFHIRDYCDFVFDPEKKLWNKLMFLLKAQDVRKMNTLKFWKINGRQTARRAGIPILTSKRRVWVDAEDSHSLIIGTTNSGKTFSVIHGMIEICRMAGESMIINDLKGELNQDHKVQLERDGYQVLIFNFVDPDKGSECWNPFGTVVEKYRKAQQDSLNSFRNAGERQHYIDLRISYIRAQSRLLKLYTQIKQSAKEEEKNYCESEYQKTLKQIEDLKSSISSIENSENYKKPDFDEAFEQLTDICRSFCEEKDAKQPHFWQRAQALMEGCVCFLLEHEYLDKKGNLRYLEDDQINFENIKHLVNQGFDRVDTPNGKTSFFEFYLSNMRRSTDKSVDKLLTIVRTGSDERGSILTTFDNKMQIGTLNGKIMKMTARTSFDFRDIATKKTAVFLVVHDEKKTYYPFVTVFVSQFYNEIVKTSREFEKQRLPIPVNIIWDEFGISPAINDPDSMFSASRFRGVRWNIVIQDYSQLDKNYGKEVAKAMKNNIMNTIYLLGGDPETLKEVSDKAGKQLKWNKERQSFDTVPVVTPDRLQHFSLSEALIIRQRKMPLLTRYYPYNRYIYASILKHDESHNPSKLKDYNLFDLKEDFNSLFRL